MGETKTFSGGLKGFRFVCKSQYKDFYVCQQARNHFYWKQTHIYSKPLTRWVNLPVESRHNLNCMTPTTKINGVTYQRCTDNCHSSTGELCTDIYNDKVCLKVNAGVMQEEEEEEMF